MSAARLWRIRALAVLITAMVVASCGGDVGATPSANATAARPAAAPSATAAPIPSSGLPPHVSWGICGVPDQCSGDLIDAEAALGRTFAVAKTYHPFSAKALTDAGWTLPDQGLYRTRAGHDFTVSLVAADAYPFREVADSVRRQLQGVGVRVTVQDVPVSQLVTRYLVGHGYQMAIASFDNGPDPDQFSLWHSSMKQYPLNVSGLPRQGFIDKALEDGRARTDAAGRMAAYADLQKLITEASPAIFLYEPHYQYAVSRRVHGLHMNPVIEPGDRFEYVTDWYITTK